MDRFEVSGLATGVNSQARRLGARPPMPVWQDVWATPSRVNRRMMRSAISPILKQPLWVRITPNRAQK